MLVIGITGPTGAGKTTALRTLESLGVRVLDCDAIYNGLLKSDEQLRRELTGRFGDVFDGDGLNRRKLGSLVWNDAGALNDLNAITHKYVMAELKRQVEDAREKNLPGVAIDAISLLESGAGDLCDTTVAVIAPREVRIARIMAREGIDRDYAAARISAQKDGAWYTEHCDHTLTNDQTEPAFRATCLDFFRRCLHLIDKKSTTGGNEDV